MKKTVVITGASKGIGKETALYFADKGWNVAATMRSIEHSKELNKIESISTYTMDVTDKGSIEDSKNQILTDFKKVDLVINNAGYGLFGAFETASNEQIKLQFDTNLFGVMEVTRAFLPHFRANRSGMFINISSMAGITTVPFISLYHSSKWALEGFSEGLSYELGQIGISVKIVEPGGTKTDFNTASLVFANNSQLEEYNESLEKFQEFSQKMSNPDAFLTTIQVAETIYSAAIDEKKQLRYIVGENNQARYKSRHENGVEKTIQQITAAVFKN